MRFSDWSSDVCSSDLLALLEAEGLVTRKQGRGTFVTGSPEERHWFGLATSWDALIRIIEGTQPRLLHLAEGVRLPPVAESEGRPAPAYRHMKRIHVKDDVPYCVIDIYLDQRIFDQAPTQHGRASCRERVGPYVEITVVAVSLKQKLK